MDAKKTNLFLVLGIILIIALLVLFVVRGVFEKPRSVAEYPLEIHIVANPNEIGVNSGPEKLNFGWIGPGYSAIRYINITNPASKARVELRLSGDFAKWVTVSDNGFALKTGESKEIAITAAVPIDAVPGNYTAALRIEFFKAFEFI